MSSIAAEPGLVDAALDREAMAPRLCSAVAAEAGIAADLVAIRPIVLKPGSRMLVAYLLEGQAGRLVVFGKQFAKPQRAQRLHEVWTALEAADLGADAGVPRVLAWLPDLQMVLYLPERGRPLDRVVQHGGAGAPLRQVGRWLARLHRSSVRPERRFHLGREVANLGEWAARVAELQPSHGGAAGRLVANLEALAEDLRLDDHVPIHKDFHYRHVIVGRRLAVLDFDEMRLGDPSFDLAHFCVYLWLFGVRSGMAGVALRRHERRFLDGYADHTGWRRDERFAFFSAYTCLKIAKQLSQSTGVHPRPAGAERQRQLQLVLDRGCALAGVVR